MTQELENKITKLMKNAVKNSQISDEINKGYENEEIENQILKIARERSNKSNDELMQFRIWLVTMQLGNGFGLQNVVEEAKQQIDMIEQK